MKTGNIVKVKPISEIRRLRLIKEVSFLETEMSKFCGKYFRIEKDISEDYDALLETIFKLKNSYNYKDCSDVEDYVFSSDWLILDTMSPEEIIERINRHCELQCLLPDCKGCELLIYKTDNND